MKWINQKRELYQHTLTGMKATKNKLKFEINDYTEGWGSKHLGWYVFITDTVNDKRYNSLWNNLWFIELEVAQAWCEEYAKTKRP